MLSICCVNNPSITPSLRNVRLFRYCLRISNIKPSSESKVFSNISNTLPCSFVIPSSANLEEILFNTSRDFFSIDSNVLLFKMLLLYKSITNPSISFMIGVPSWITFVIYFSIKDVCTFLLLFFHMSAAHPSNNASRI